VSSTLAEKERCATGTANWGLAQLMRPAKAAPAVPFANLPLCQHPNVRVSNHRGILARWYHTNPPCLTYDNTRLSAAPDETPYRFDNLIINAALLPTSSFRKIACR
jgi:hypothetical protein